MKQMNKEELILLFIEQLGDNKILGRWMSKEEIQKKLDSIIGDVTYYSEKGNTEASWRIGKGKGTLNFDLSKIPDNEQNVIIVHELLHALWTTIYEEKNKQKVIVKCGLEFSEIYYNLENDEKDIFVENTAINEGMVDFLAEQITGISHNGYHTEKDIYKLLSIVIGKENLLNEAFSNNMSIKPSNSLLDCVMTKYGKELGQKLDDALRKVLKLSDQLTTLERNDTIYRLSENNKEIQSEVKDELYSTLKQIFERIVDDEKDFEKKIDIVIKCFATSLGHEISEKVLGELSKSNIYSSHQKLDVLHRVGQEKKSYIPSSVIMEILFKTADSKKISVEDRLKYYMELYKDHTSTEFIDLVCQLYFESGRVSEEIFNKKNAFKKIMKNSKTNRKIKTIEDLEQFFESIKYRKIGNYYEIEYDTDSMLLAPVIIDGNGNIEELFMISRDPLRNENLTRLDQDRISRIDANVDELWAKIKELCLIKKRERSNIEYQVYVIGKDEIRLQYFDDTDEFQTMTYILDNERNLVLGEVGEERRFTDDMSQLDIELKRQTSDISLTEMMKEAENINASLSIPKQIIPEIPRGEEYD